MSHHEKRSVAQTMRNQLLVVGALVFIAVLVAGLAPHLTLKNGFVSPEVKFTDASTGGMQIVPASCPSYPHSATDCSGPGNLCPADQHDVVGTGCVCNIVGASPDPTTHVCACPAGQVSDGVSCIPLTQPASCTCPVGYGVSGSSCVPAPTTYPPGAYDVVVPDFISMTIGLYGAGGGGASYAGGTPAGPGGNSSIAELGLVAGGGTGGACNPVFWTCSGSVAPGGTASGGSTNMSGSDGGACGWPPAPGGPAANGGPGNGGNASSRAVASWPGGGGAYTSKVYNQGDIAVGTHLTLVVGGGGANGPCYANDASNGGPGQAVISIVSNSAPPPISCTCPAGYSLSGTTCNLANNAPVNVNSTISPKPVAADGTTQYTITDTSTDADGGATIRNQYAMVNYQGVNAPQYRGYVGWSSSAFAEFWGGTGNLKPGSLTSCAGGGQGGIYNGYGPSYINLVSCSTSVSGTQRVSTFVVTFDPSFTTPVNTNTLSEFTEDNTGRYANWAPFDTFNLATCTPDGTSSCTADAMHVQDKCGTIIATCTSPASCVASGSTASCQCADNYFCSGNDLMHQATSCAVSVDKICSYGCTANACNPTPPLPTITFNVTPLLLRKTETAQVTWSTTNATACTVTSTNGDSWTGTCSAGNCSGTQTSRPISTATIFTIRCNSSSGPVVTQSKNVNIIPTFCEPGEPGC